MRLVADMVRKMTPYQAVETLRFTNRAAAADLAKAIKTAIANAGNAEGLRFERLEINEDMKLRRYRVGTAGRGRGRAYRKRFSQIKVVLTDEAKVEKPNVIASVAKQSQKEIATESLTPRNDDNEKGEKS